MESMNNKTVQYKRTLRGSVGAGVNALFNGNGRRYYILEHKDASKYHKAGESQKIIIDQIELGRDSNCQVRFDETFSTVSRRHAAIMKDGERWKLVQLSKTNSTFLNGRPIEAECYLENGDEIQLSVGGPRMGFIVPAGKQSLVSSIKMTERLDLFRKQALKPYKTAIACLAVVLLIVASGGGYALHYQQIHIDEQGKTIVKQDSILNQLNNENDSITNAMAVMEDNWIKQKEQYIAEIARIKATIPPNVASLIEKAKKDVYYLHVQLIGSLEGQEYLLGAWSGTAFLLDDGRLVTARHCISERYNPDTSWRIKSIEASGGSVRKEIVAHTPSGESFSIPANAFHVDESYDITANYSRRDSAGNIIATYPIKVPFPLDGSKAQRIIFGTDWAYAKINRKGSISANSELSKNMKAGASVHVLGFPQTMGVNDGDKLIEPIYNTMSISRDGLNDANCITVSQGIDHGNSGGPVFALVKQKLEVIGIVSRGDDKSNLYNQLVPISNMKQ